MQIRIRIQFWIQGFGEMRVIFSLLDPDPDPATQINADPDPQPWYTPKGMDRKRDSFVREIPPPSYHYLSLCVVSADESRRAGEDIECGLLEGLIAARRKPGQPFKGTSSLDGYCFLHVLLDTFKSK
jgi:hypothetical protein